MVVVTVDFVVRCENPDHGKEKLRKSLERAFFLPPNSIRPETLTQDIVGDK